MIGYLSYEPGKEKILAHAILNMCNNGFILKVRPGMETVCSSLFAFVIWVGEVLSQYQGTLIV